MLLFVLSLDIVVATARPFDEVTSALQRGDNEGAYRFLQALAAQDLPEAKFSRGKLLEAGRGAAKDPAQALKWYQLAAEMNEPNAAFELGVIYGTDRGVPQDPVASANWFVRAALLGHAEAQFALGMRYATGRGLVRNEVIASRWLSRAAAQGLVAAESSGVRGARPGSPACARWPWPSLPLIQN